MQPHMAIESGYVLELAMAQVAFHRFDLIGAPGGPRAPRSPRTTPARRAARRTARAAVLTLLRLVRKEKVLAEVCLY